LVWALLCCAYTHAAHAEPGAALTVRGAALRGVTVGPIESSQQSGRGYGTESSARLLDELARLGVNAISITPFGRLWSLQSTQIALDFELPIDQGRAAVARFVAQAKARGLYVLIIPHLWVETAGWRGEVDPGSETGWLAYQASYRRFLLYWAGVAAASGADAFSIGVECKSWSGRFGAYWTQLIADVRATFHGQLTYSANWDEADNVLFWDRLDFVGINAFYPLSESNDASYREYAAGAERAVAKAIALGKLVAKPVVFVEIGYTARADAAVQPWLWPDSMRDVVVDEWEQARALAALTSAAASQRRFGGFFVWRYYADLDDVSQEAIWGFSPHGKLAEQLLANVFGARWAADADATLLPSEPGQGRMTTPSRVDRY
jgi:nucleotide-binding universal stress UspA family protein